MKRSRYLYTTWCVGRPTKLHNIIGQICSSKNVRHFTLDYLNIPSLEKHSPLINADEMEFAAKISKQYGIKNINNAYRLINNISNIVDASNTGKPIIWGESKLLADIARYALEKRGREYLIGENWLVDSEIILNQHGMFLGEYINIDYNGIKVLDGTTEYIDKLVRDRNIIKNSPTRSDEYILFTVPFSKWVPIKNVFYSMMNDTIRSFVSSGVTSRLVIKFHPQDIIDNNINLKKIHLNDNIELLTGKENLTELIRGCKYLVTYNSKTIFEAMILGKKVLHIGPFNIATSGLVTKLEKESDWKQKGLSEFNKVDIENTNKLFQYLKDNYITELSLNAIEKKVTFNNYSEEREQRYLRRYYCLLLKQSENYLTGNEGKKATPKHLKNQELLYSIQNSTSWKITAPLRGVIDIFKHD